MASGERAFPAKGTHRARSVRQECAWCFLLGDLQGGQCGSSEVSKEEGGVQKGNSRAVSGAELQAPGVLWGRLSEALGRAVTQPDFSFGRIALAAVPAGNRLRGWVTNNGRPPLE